MKVSYDQSGTYNLVGSEWIQRPLLYSFIDLRGQITGDTFSGSVLKMSGTTFSLVKDAPSGQPAAQASTTPASASQTATVASKAATPITGGPGVYLLFGRGNVWKDGTEYSLANASSTTSLFVSGNDVYVAGSSKGESFNRATLWKNGEQQQLDTVASDAVALYVSGNDVYVVGTIGQSEAQRPVLWKNGERQVLSEKRGNDSWKPTHVSVWNSDVYVVGVSSARLNESMLWKNGKEEKISLTVEYNISQPSIFISDGNIYVTDLTGINFWKNGQLQTMNGFTRNLGDKVAPSYGSGKDMYVAGTFKNNNNKAKLWKNGVEQKLEVFENPESLQEINTNAQFVFVSGSDVYVFGARDAYKAGGTNYPSAYIIWKNGVAEVLKQPKHSYFGDNIRSFFVAK
jgi:hypothetical protein